MKNRNLKRLKTKDDICGFKINENKITKYNKIVSGRTENKEKWFLKIFSYLQFFNI